MSTWTNEHAERLRTWIGSWMHGSDVLAALTEIERLRGVDATIERLCVERDEAREELEGLHSTTDRLKASTASAHAKFHKANAKAAYAVAEADKLRSKLKTQSGVFHELKRSLYYARRETDELRALSAAPSREQEHAPERSDGALASGEHEAAPSSAPSPGTGDAQARRSNLINRVVRGCTIHPMDHSRGVGEVRRELNADASDALEELVRMGPVTYMGPPQRRAEGRWITRRGADQECSLCGYTRNYLTDKRRHESECWRAEPERGEAATAWKGLLTPPTTGQNFAAPPQPDALKPCPFCGESASRWNDGKNVIACEACGIEIRHDDGDAATAAWNARHGETP